MTSETLPNWVAVIDRATHGLALVVQRIAIAALFVLALVILADVIGRTFFSFTVRGIYEVSGLVMAVVMAAVITPAFLRRRNIGMDFLNRYIGDDSISHFIASVTETAFLGLLAQQLLMRGADAAEYGEEISLLGWATSPFWYVAGGFLMFGALACLWSAVPAFVRVSHNSWRKNLRAVIMIGIAVAVALAIIAYAVGGGMSSGMQAVAAFAALYLFILAGLPIAVSLGLTGFAFVALVIGKLPALGIVQSETAQALSSTDLAAIPLFLLMGNFAVQAGIAGDIFRAVSSLTTNLRGGLAVASVAGCGAFGAICGSSVATTATFGKVAFDEMSKRGYDKGLASGSLAAGGTLGALIPPSVVLIVYCILVEASIQTAFMASLVPGLLAMVLYIISIMVQVRLSPKLAPKSEPFDGKRAMHDIVRAWRPILMFLLVLGGLYGGLFTTQEAAAVGAVLAFVFAVTTPGFSFKGMLAAFDDSAINAVVIYSIVIGANIFAGFLSLSDITSSVLSLVNLETTPHWLILLVIVIMYLALGSVFDTMAAVLVTAPFVIPLIQGMNYDLIWWGVVTLSLVEIGMITPPIGMNVFVMKSTINNSVSLATIFRGVVPFLIADLFRLVLLIMIPGITLWLPSLLQ